MTKSNAVLTAGFCLVVSMTQVTANAQAPVFTSADQAKASEVVDAVQTAIRTDNTLAQSSAPEHRPPRSDITRPGETRPPVPPPSDDDPANTYATIRLSDELGAQLAGVADKAKSIEPLLTKIGAEQAINNAINNSTVPVEEKQQFLAYLRERGGIANATRLEIEQVPQMAAVQRANHQAWAQALRSGRPPPVTSHMKKVWRCGLWTIGAVGSSILGNEAAAGVCVAGFFADDCLHQ
ncbi:hypothetical protein [Paraburkholderia sp. BR14320]|uniref:hypothetical protein n=1 Tax=unclassified Paraburkholderia TaxID=2615204 RepID=UPI0034CFE9B5